MPLTVAFRRNPTATTSHRRTPPAAQELSLRHFLPVPDERQQLACMVRDVDCTQRAGSLLEKLYDLDCKARRLIVGNR
jgi:predicted transcriptional regulator